MLKKPILKESKSQFHSFIKDKTEKEHLVYTLAYLNKPYSIEKSWKSKKGFIESSQRE